MPFVHPFCRNAAKEGRKLIYFRFADHQSLLPEDVKAEIFRLHPEDGFENFIDEIFSKIERFGIGTCYIFDSLSELAVDWYSDRMLGNFFKLVCPYLYDFDTATYFGMIKHLHTDLAIEAIHGTAQVVIDVFRSKGKLYVYPLKVYKRNSSKTYMLYRYDNDGNFNVVKQSSVISEVLGSTPLPWLGFSSYKSDLWTRTFLRAQEEVELAKGKNDISEKNSTLLQKIIRMAVTRDPHLVKLAEKYLELSDVVEIGKRMIGTGLIGGKAAGMVIARAILKKTNPKWSEKLSVLDSFYIGSDVYYSYLIENNCWWIKRKCKESSIIPEIAYEAEQRLLNGTFPEDIIEQFKEMLNYFCQSPIIVRSSSLLEDAFGNAFSGKYESVFCANQGTPKQRLENFMKAVKTVYASTLSKEALSYRARKGLLDKDEQMAILVQRVSGSFYGNYYFPQIAGVGFSFNPYVWHDDIKKEDGVIRMVFGLGTRAVERNGEDYTRIVSLSVPLLRPEATFQEMKRYTQRYVDVINLSTNKLETKSFEDVVKMAEKELPLEYFTSEDEDAAVIAKEMEREDIFTKILDFKKLLSETTFPQDMKEILKTLETAYEHPVDIEFTSNIWDAPNVLIGIVQCRPFQIKEKSKLDCVSKIKEGEILLKSNGPIIGNSLLCEVDTIVYVVPEIYSSLKMSERYRIARMIGKILQEEEREQEKRIILMGPGRWGTSTPSLGIPVTFSEINRASILCEIALMHEGLIPDISLGTHFFNDLVELDILYMAVHPNRAGSIFNKTFFESCEIKNKDTELSKVIKVIDGRQQKIIIDAETEKQEVVFLRLN
ncbi:MAG: PEP/pyruvate-binding domain-containing protein [Chitinispirillaceae bacterium]|nr:PEP/pyruvate-binding domain-containing protein [Chitinispirillaceae bacterium]